MNKPPLPKQQLHQCRDLRRNSTDAEKRLWRQLRDRQIAGAKFRRQQPVGPYVLDFYCHEAQLSIELDGGQHAEEEQGRRDEERTQYLAEQGIRELRFWNNEVLADTKAVLERIWNSLTPALSRGERGQDAAGERGTDAEGEEKNG